MTIRRKSKRRSHVRIRRYSQNPSATHAGTAIGAAVNAKPTDESTHSNSTESTERADWEPRLVRMTPVESAISNAVDRQNGDHHSKVASRNRTAIQEEPDDSEANAQGENETAQSEQLRQQIEAEEQKNAVSESLQEAVSISAKAIEADQNEGPAAGPIDTKSKSAEASSHDAIDFLMQDFMNSQPSLPTPEEVTWDIKIEPRPLPKDSRIARVATISTLLVSILGIGGFIAYNKLVVPTPVVLGMASANIEFPDPIHLSDGKSDRYLKKNPNKPVDTNASSNPSAVQAQPSKQSTAAEIVPEITSINTAASAEKPAVDQKPEVASSSGSAPLSDTSIGTPPNSNQQAASEPTAATDQATNVETTLAGSTQTDIEATYRQTVEKASRFHKRSQRAKAKKEFQRALDINPNGTEALGKLAFYSLEESKYAAAIELAERATRIDPNNSEGWIVLGAARQATADRKGAMLAYRKCSESTGQYVKECRRLLR